MFTGSSLFQFLFPTFRDFARMRDVGLKGSLYWATASAATVFRTRRYPFAVVAALLADTDSNHASTSLRVECRQVEVAEARQDEPVQGVSGTLLPLTA